MTHLLLLVALLAASPDDRSAPDLEPVPLVQTITAASDTVVIGESFDLSVDALNNGGVADLGYLSVSFPDFTAVDDTQRVEFLSGASSPGGVYAEFPVGTSLRHKDTSFIEAVYLASQYDFEPWNEQESRTLALRVTPKVTGTFRVQIRVFMEAKQFWNDPESGQTDQQGWSVITRTFTVVEQPAISVTPATLDFGSVVVGGDSTATIQIQNTGGGTLSGSVSVSEGAPDFAIVTGEGGFSIGSGTAKDVVVRFSPSSIGSKIGTLRLTHDGANVPSPLDVAMSGTGVSAPAIGVAPGGFDYGSVNVGGDSVTTFTLLNTGGQTLEGEVFVVDGASEFSIVSGGGAFSLASGVTRDVVVRFAPSSGGAKQGSLRFVHNGVNESSPLDLDLAGTGVPRPRIFIEPTSFDFGTVRIGRDSSTTFVVRNDGGQMLEGQASIARGGGVFAISSGGEPFMVPPGGSTEVVVRFAPTAVGAASATLRIEHNASNRDTPLQTSLTGTGFDAPAISLSPEEFDFGIVRTGEDTATTFVIENTGGDGLAGDVSLVDAPSDIFIESGGGQYSLDAGGRVEVVVRFSPSSAGTYTAVLRVIHNDDELSSPIDAPLTGMSVDGAAIAVTPDSLDFGKIRLGSDSSRTLTIENRGGQPLAGEIALDAGAPVFQIVAGDGAFNLGPGEERSVEVRFEPSAALAFAGTIGIVHDGTNSESPLFIGLAGVGEVVEMTISLDGDSLDFDALGPGDSTAAFVIGNSGPDTLLGVVTILNSASEMMGKSGVLADSAFSLASDAGEFSLSEGEDLEVVVVFHPPATGRFEAVVSIEHNATNLTSPIEIRVVGTKASGVASESEALPEVLDLLQNYPNPAGHATHITFVLDRTETIRLVVYDLLGRQVAALVEGSRPAGRHTVTLATDKLPSGQYLYRLEAGQRVRSRTLTVSSRR